MKNNMKNTTSIGRYGEKIACEYLKNQKYKIIDQNFYSSHNEIDIIAENKQYIIFVEVKTRSCLSIEDLNYGSPASAVTYSKQKRTLAAARSYLNEHQTRKSPRLDVIEVFLNKNDNSVIKINHIEDAFGN